MKPPDELERLLGVEEVAALCGVPPKTVHTWIYKHEGPKSLRVGKYRRFRRSDVAAWWESLARNP